MMKKLCFHGGRAVLWAALVIFWTAVLLGRAAAAEIAEQTIFADRTPDGFQDLTYGKHLNLGIRFQARRPGALLGCRIYTAEDETDLHEVRVWDAENGALLLGPLDWVPADGSEGWQEYRFSEALPIEAAHVYVLSVSNSEQYQGYACGSSQPERAQDLETFPDSGVYDEDFSRMPAQTAGDIHYFRDVIFLPDEPYVTALDHISVTRLPERLTYFAGTSFDPAGLEVTAFFADGSRRILSPDEYTYQPGGPLSEMDQAVTIAFENQSADVPLTVLPVTLSGIFLSKFPDRTAYSAGECFDPGGMEVTARYSDGSCRVVSDYVCAPDGPLTAADTEIVVMYQNEYTTCAIRVSPPALDGVFPVRMPDRTAYLAGEVFDPTGLEVAARYSDGSCQTVLDYTYAPSGALTAADTEIVVRFQGKTTVIPIQVTAPAPAPEPPAQTAKDHAAVLSAPAVRALLETAEDTLIVPIRTAARVPAEALRLAADRELGLRFTAEEADLLLPPQAVRALSQRGATTVFSLERTGPQAFSCTVTADGAPLTEIPGGIALSIPWDADPGTAAILTAPDGGTQVVRGAYAAAGRLCVPLSGPAAVFLRPNAREFQDVGPSEAVAFVSSRELFRGVAGGAFAPEAQMTRAMLAQVLHNLAGNPDSPTARFTDVPEAAWYAAAADWAADRGLAPEDSFRGGADVTRREFAEMLRRYAGGAPPGAAQDGAALQWAVEAGLFSDAGDPDGTMTRLEAAELIQRYLELGLHLDRGLARCVT